MKKIPLVIITYDKYSELWKYNIDSINRYLNAEIYIITNSYDKQNKFDENVHVIVTEEDDWSENLDIGISRLSEDYNLDYALFTFDDLIIQSINNRPCIDEAFRLIKKDEIAAIKLSHSHLGEEKFNESFNFVTQNKYKTTLVFTVWDLNVLQELASLGYNPWEFEVNGYKHLPNTQYTVLSSGTNLIDYFNSIVKGKVVRDASFELNEFKKMSVHKFVLYKMKLTAIRTLNKLRNSIRSK